MSCVFKQKYSLPHSLPLEINLDERSWLLLHNVVASTHRVLWWLSISAVVVVFIVMGVIVVPIMASRLLSVNEGKLSVQTMCMFHNKWQHSWYMISWIVRRLPNGFFVFFWALPQRTPHVYTFTNIMTLIILREQMVISCYTAWPSEGKEVKVEEGNAWWHTVK